MIDRRVIRALLCGCCLLAGLTLAGGAGARPSGAAAPGHRFTLLSVSASRQRERLVLRLELVEPGRLSLRVTAAHTTVAALTRWARASTLTWVARLKPPPVGLLGARGRETLSVSVTFTPVEGSPQTLTRSLTLAPTQK